MKNATFFGVENANFVNINTTFWRFKTPKVIYEIGCWTSALKRQHLALKRRRLLFMKLTPGGKMAKKDYQVVSRSVGLLHFAAWVHCLVVAALVHFLVVDVSGLPGTWGCPRR